MVCSRQLIHCAATKKMADYTVDSFMHKVVHGKSNHYHRSDMSYILASDCRSISADHQRSDRNFLGQKFTWVKADPTFEGLKQLTREPEGRIYLGEKPPQLQQTSHQPGHFIDSICIHSKSSKNVWFDNVHRLPLNSGLVAIIGNKGNGKSALADIIASGNIAAQYPRGLNGRGVFSFLNKYKFLGGRSTPHQKYSSEVHFKDGYTGKGVFSNPYLNQKGQEKVIYLSQSFVNYLCDGDKDGHTPLAQEIKRVIFSHIPDSERLADNMDSLIEKKTTHLESRKLLVKKELEKVNRRIVQLEAKSEPAYRQQLQNDLLELHRQLKHLKRNEPVKIAPPAADKKQQELEMVNAQKQLQQQQLKNNESLLKKLRVNELKLNQSVEKLRNFEQQFFTVSRELESDEMLGHMDVDMNEVLHLKIRFDVLGEILAQNRQQIAAVDEIINVLKVKLAELALTQQKLEQQLSSSQRAFRSRQQETEVWTEQVNALKGSINEPGTITFLEEQLDFIDLQLQEELLQAKAQRREICLDLMQLIEQKKEVLKCIYSPARSYTANRAAAFGIDTSEFMQFNSDIQFAADFAEQLFDFINHNRSGTFYGVQNAYEQLQKLMDFVDLSAADSVVTFPELVLKALQHDLGNDPDQADKNYRRIPEDQLRKPKEALYDYLFSLSYLEPTFNITYDNKQMDALSPGEKGTLLLIFYLLVDRSRLPIIIDQPEENLDNQTVYNRLVKFLKKVKEQRQVIMVTHNPNLAIVCDAEQIILARMDKQNGNQVSYTSGSIENPQIKQAAIDILEGTLPAFVNRKEKYNLV